MEEWAKIIVYKVLCIKYCEKLLEVFDSNKRNCFRHFKMKTTNMDVWISEIQYDFKKC